MTAPKTEQEIRDELERVEREINKAEIARVEYYQNRSNEVVTSYQRGRRDKITGDIQELRMRRRALLWVLGQ